LGENMKRLTPVETDEYQLDVIECDCGMHIGLDFSYIDQIGDISTECPNCKKTISSDDSLLEKKSKMNIVRCKNCNQLFWMHLRKNIETGLCTSCLNKAKRRIKMLKFERAIPYDIRIQSSSNNGFIVTVGCCTCVFSNKDDLKKALGEFLDDPRKMEKEYNSSSAPHDRTERPMTEDAACEETPRPGVPVPRGLTASSRS